MQHPGQNTVSLRHARAGTQFTPGLSWHAVLCNTQPAVIVLSGGHMNIWFMCLTYSAPTEQRGGTLLKAANDTVHNWWSCRSGHKLLCKLCRTFPPPAIGARFTFFWASRPCGPAGWLALLLTKAGDVETNPGPTTSNKRVSICDICYKQIHVRKQISIRCNRIEHWVHLRYAGIRQA